VQHLNDLSPLVINRITGISERTRVKHRNNLSPLIINRITGISGRTRVQHLNDLSPLIINIIITGSNSLHAFRGLIRLHAFWSLHLFLGRPAFHLSVRMYSHTNVTMRVSLVLSKGYVNVHLQGVSKMLRQIETRFSS
jgi:hypothetical protein